MRFLMQQQIRSALGIMKYGSVKVTLNHGFKKVAIRHELNSFLQRKPTISISPTYQTFSQSKKQRIQEHFRLM